MKTSKMTKRWLAFLMMIVMVLTSQPVTSLADTVVGIVNRGPDESETTLPADTVRKNVVTFEIAEGAKVTVNGTEIPDGGTAEAEDGTLLYVVEPEDGYQISDVKEILAEEEIPGRLNEHRDDEGNLIENTTEYIIEEITTDEIIVRVSAEPVADILSGPGATELQTETATAELQTEAPAAELQTETGAAGSEDQTETAGTEGVTETTVTELQTEAAETEAAETELQTEVVTEAAETEAVETELQSEAVTEEVGTETEVQTETMTEATETEVQTEAVTEAAETEAQTEAVTEAAETEAQTEIVTEAAETEAQTEVVTEAAETEIQTEAVTEAAETEAQTEAVTETAETEEIIDEPEGVSEAVVLEAQTADGKIVKLSAPEGAFTVPASEVTMTADSLTAEQEAAIVEQLTAMAEAEDKTLIDYVAYDINLWVNGEIVEPLVAVQVIFENVDLTADIAADETPDGTTTEEVSADGVSEVEAVGFHMDNDTMELSGVNETTVTGEETPEDATVGVEVEHFSPAGYGLMSNNSGIAPITANNPNVNLKFSGSTGGTIGEKNFNHNKRIDYLGDETENKESGIVPSVEDAEDLYRIYLDMTGASDPVDLLLVADKSGSMSFNFGSGKNPPKRYQTINGMLSNTQGSLVRTFLEANAGNRVKIITFSSTASDWGRGWQNAEQYKGYSVEASEATNYADALIKADNALDALDKEYKSKNETSHKRIMIFISDGSPTYYMYYDRQGRLQTGGTGYSAEQGYPDNENTCIDRTKTPIDNFLAAEKNLTVYTVGLNLSKNPGPELLTKLGTSGYIPANDQEALLNSIKQILFPCNVTISDKLSDYVEFYTDSDGVTADDKGIRVTMAPVSDPEKKTDLYANGEVTSNGKTILANPAISINKDTKTISVNFEEKYALDPNYIYTLSFNVKLNQYAKNKYLKSGYDSKGDEDTDYNGNCTSSGEAGFRSNENATVTYKDPANPDVPKTEYYKHPVVQTHEPRKTSEQADQIVGIGSEITYEIEYVNNEGERADVHIVDQLDKGLTYVEGSAKPYTPSYDAATNTLTWDITDAPFNERQKITFQATSYNNR